MRELLLCSFSTCWTSWFCRMADECHKQFWVNQWTQHSALSLLQVAAFTVHTHTVSVTQWQHTAVHFVMQSGLWTLLWIPLDTALIETFPRFLVTIIIILILMGIPNTIAFMRHLRLSLLNSLQFHFPAANLKLRWALYFLPGSSPSLSSSLFLLKLS